MKFSDFGFKKFINDSLNEMNISNPTDIQKKVIPLFKKNFSIIGKSDTGTGKTLAFLLPILNNIDYDKKDSIQGTIIAPTRELAYQIYQVAKLFIKHEPRLTVGLFTGGESVDEQKRKLQDKQPMLVICTPSRMKQLYEGNNLRVTTSDYIVIDECDMIFDFGFIEDIDLVLSKAKENVKKLVFSATIPEELKIFLEKYFSNSQYVEIKSQTVTNENIENRLIWTKNRDNKEVLKKIINTINPYVCLIFVNRKEQINELNEWLGSWGIKPGILSGDLEPNKRLNMFKKVINNEFKYVICTDLASRGIDIKGVSHVISINLPNDLSYYTHRSGRTGRAGQTGISYVLHNTTNQASIEKLISLGIKFANFELIDGELVDIDIKQKSSPKKKSVAEDTNIKKIKGKYSSKKVKPGYKKKMNNEIEDYKKKKRREHIKESINKIKKEKYKKRREDIFE